MAPFATFLDIPSKCVYLSNKQRIELFEAARSDTEAFHSATSANTIAT